ncbi:MAG: hypothetical protein KDA21_15485 [Phycisphaerales bacterium]|nr:hypothetical protein [Phycisphaerales bacterium]
MQHNTAVVREAIFRFGQISTTPMLRNQLVLRRLVETAAEILEAEVVGAAVYENGIEHAARAACVIGPWTRDESQRFLKQSQWSIEDRVLAVELAARPRGVMYRRSDLIEEEAFTRSRLYQDFQKPMGLGDQALGLFQRADGAELLVGVNAVGPQAELGEQTVERCCAIAPFMAQAWAWAWIREPDWMQNLKPQARRVLDHVLEGFDDDQIAELTGLTYHSVRAHLKRLFREANVRSRLHLMQACRTLQDARMTDAAEIVAAG